MSRFKAEIQEIVVHFTVEVAPDLLMWMDLGGTRVSGTRIDGTSAERACDIFGRFEAIEDIDRRSIEYNGILGPYVFFACEQAKAQSVTKAVISVIEDCERRMLRSAAYRAKQKRSASTPMAVVNGQT